MKNSITFLGTAGDAISVGKQVRASGGIILNFDGTIFHMDPGPGAVVRAAQYGINPREITAILVSHNHLNHAGGANEMISAMTYAGIDKRGVLICDEETLDCESSKSFLSAHYKGMVERFISLKPGSKIAVNEVNIAAVKTVHTDTSVGFRFFTEKLKVSYTSDTEYSDEVAEGFKDTDVLILNCKYPSGLSQKGHMNSDDAVNMINKVNPKLVIITHFGVKMLDADTLHEAREIQKKTKSQVLAAKDGLIVNPLSYASTLMQRKLDSF